MAKTGRPKIKIDWAEFDKLCTMQCSLREIAGWFDVSEDTIERRVVETFGITFAEQYDKKRARGKIALRRKQYDVAMSGSVPMLIFLGKQYLGQSDKVEQVGELNNVIQLAYAAPSRASGKHSNNQHVQPNSDSLPD